ncbi:4109_t:CDS:2, partial [Racocetra persica]
SEDTKTKSNSNKAANFNADIASEDEISSTISTNSETLKTNLFKRQTIFTIYVLRPLFEKDKPHFKNLVLRIIISNSLSFTFIENNKIQEVFNFIALALKLSNRQAVSNRILPRYLEKLVEDILQYICANKIRVIAAFDG